MLNEIHRFINTSDGLKRPVAVPAKPRPNGIEKHPLFKLKPIA